VLYQATTIYSNLKSLLQEFPLALECFYVELGFRCHSKLVFLQLRNLSSFGTTAKETHTSTSSVSIVCPLQLCVSTSRLPRNFHIGCCMSSKSLRGDLLNRYRVNSFSSFIKNDRSIISVFGQTRHIAPSLRVCDPKSLARNSANKSQYLCTV
jgi:hypothetical protein